MTKIRKNTITDAKDARVKDARKVDKVIENQTVFLSDLRNLEVARKGKTESQTACISCDAKSGGG